MAKKNAALTRLRREHAALTDHYNQMHAQRDQLLHEKRTLEEDLEQLRERFARSEANFTRAVEERNEAIAKAKTAEPKVVTDLEAKLREARLQCSENHGRAEELRALTTLLLSRLIGE